MRPIRRFSQSILPLLVLTAVPMLAAQRQSPCQPCETLFHRLRSQLYALIFRYDEAIADMDAAIALDPDNPALYVERGQRILLLYEWDRVLVDYNRALELDPLYADAYYYRGILYASVPEGIDARRLALADFERYLELAPDDQHTADATRYAAEIQAQLSTLDTDS